MTSRRPPARSLAALGTAILLAGFAGPTPASGIDADAALDRVIRSDAHLTRLFAGTTARQFGGDRAWALSEDADSRYAVAVFRTREAGLRKSIGPRVCRAALLGAEQQVRQRRLEDRIGDPAVAAAIMAGQPVSGTLRGVTHYTSRPDDGWSSTICRVHKADLDLANDEAIDAADIAAARYRVGKQLFRAAQHEKAVEQFRQTRERTEIYANAVLFIFAIQLPVAPDLARQIQAHVVTLDRASDPEALEAYIAALGRSGDRPAADAARVLAGRLR